MIVMIMGVTGSGKTVVGSLLASQLGWKFADADNFHSRENIEKMRRGLGLSDADREPWLRAIHAAMAGWEAENQGGVMACSALKESYRQLLCADLPVKLVYLKGTYELIAHRLTFRHGHYATESLLASQFAALEEPANAIVVDITKSPEEVVSEIRRQLGLA